MIISKAQFLMESIGYSMRIGIRWPINQFQRWMSNSIIHGAKYPFSTWPKTGLYALNCWIMIYKSIINWVETRFDISVYHKNITVAVNIDEVLVRHSTDREKFRPKMKIKSGVKKCAYIASQVRRCQEIIRHIPEKQSVVYDDIIKSLAFAGFLPSRTFNHELLILPNSPGAGVGWVRDILCYFLCYRHQLICHGRCLIFSRCTAIIISTLIATTCSWEDANSETETR